MASKYIQMNNNEDYDDYPYIVSLIEEIHNKFHDVVNFKMNDYFIKLQEYLIHYRKVPSSLKNKDVLYQRLKKAAHQFKSTYKVDGNVALMNVAHRYKQKLIEVIKNVIMDSSLDSEEESFEDVNNNLIAFSTDDEEEDLITF